MPERRTTWVNSAFRKVPYRIEGVHVSPVGEEESHGL